MRRGGRGHNCQVHGWEERLSGIIGTTGGIDKYCIYFLSRVNNNIHRLTFNDRVKSLGLDCHRINSGMKNYIRSRKCDYRK